MGKENSSKTPEGDEQQSHQLTFWTPKFMHTVFNVDLQNKSAAQMSFSKLDDQRFNFKRTYTIMCAGKFLAFQWGKPVKVWAYDNVSNKAKMSKT